MPEVQYPMSSKHSTFHQVYCSLMLFLDSISILQFKNYVSRQFAFDQSVVGIYGKNGVGKTNLLDAIHYLCFTKSYFSRLDAVNVHQGMNGFRLEGDFRLNDQVQKIVCVLRETGKKELSLNNNVYEKFSHHIGKFPAVVIAPDDIRLIIGGSEERRTFIDMLMSQLDSEYLQSLIGYNKLLQQRNSLLRAINEGRGRSDVLDVIDEQIIPYGNSIFQKRQAFMLAFLPGVKKLYNEIATQNEHISVVYESQLEEGSFEELLSLNRPRDLSTCRTTFGPHRDDLSLQLTGQPFKNIASQGQRKSLLFALKLAEMNELHERKGFAPILLLDDVFEKLDEERVASLLRRVCSENQGHIFITDTNGDRLQQHLEKAAKSFQLLQLR